MIELSRSGGAWKTEVVRDATRHDANKYSASPSSLSLSVSYEHFWINNIKYVHDAAVHGVYFNSKS